MVFYFFIIFCKNSKSEKPFTCFKNPNNSLQLTCKLAYLGLNQFVNGLENDQFKEQYLLIFNGDSSFFENDVLSYSLRTASTPLIQGTLDFLGQQLKRKFNLIINDKHLLSSFLFDNNPIDLKMKNNNYHFFIQKPEDTKGDGYCFFHALIFLLKEKKLFSENIINASFDKIDLIKNSYNILYKIKKIKEKYE
ncbi:MAG: hypothetical protein QS2022_0770 [Candidatus Phytoplasma asteris]|nr:MAG: hypothetical protein PLY_0760 [Periwinkle leaf yellowing phytoplasma]WEX19367.1 MAG: hypothetical protein QS2022_0770 [Candidatus Phytoplasma asteris]